jgi:hypothetical protein
MHNLHQLQYNHTKGESKIHNKMLHMHDNS